MSVCMWICGHAVDVCPDVDVHPDVELWPCCGCLSACGFVAMLWMSPVVDVCPDVACGYMS